MIRRSIAVGALAAAIIAFPTAAMAEEYPAGEASLVCDATVVTAGDEFGCKVVTDYGDEGHIQVSSPVCDVAIAGTVTSAPKSVASGEAPYVVDTTEGCSGMLDITGYVDGEPVGVAQVQVIAGGVLDEEVVEEEGTLSAGGVVTAEETLSATGFESLPMAVGAGVLLLAGVGVVMVAARRTAAGTRS